MLLDWGIDRIPISENAVKAAAGNRSEVMELLLDRVWRPDHHY